MVEKLNENFINIAENLGMNIFHPILQMFEELWEDDVETPEMRDKMWRLSEFKIHFFNLLKIIIKKCGGNILTLSDGFV